MKRALLSIATLTLAASAGFAQITINQGSFGNMAGTTDRSIRARANSYTAFPLTDHINVPRPSGYTWDINSVYGDTTTGSVYARHVAYTGYSFADSMTDGFNTTYTFKTKVATNIAAGGMIQDKEHITKQIYSLSSLPGGTATDTLVVLEQDAIYYDPGFLSTPAPRTALEFPLTLNTSWLNSYYYKIKATITFASLGYVDDTIERRRYINEDYIVIGYGNMRVRKHTSGSPWSDYFNVLQTRANYIQVRDSFFINNVAATPAELSLLGLTQGQFNTYYRDHFYRTGEVVPLTDVHYTDAGRNTVQDAAADRSLIHTQRLSPSSVNGIELNDNFAIFPNPVKAGATLVVDLKDNMANGNWSYNIINVTGQQVATGTLNLNSGKANITLPNVIAGIYYIQATNGDKKIVKALDIE